MSKTDRLEIKIDYALNQVTKWSSYKENKPNDSYAKRMIDYYQGRLEIFYELLNEELDKQKSHLVHD